MFFFQWSLTLCNGDLIRKLFSKFSLYQNLLLQNHASIILLGKTGDRTNKGHESRIKIKAIYEAEEIDYKKNFHLLPSGILCSPQAAVGPPNLQPQYLLHSLLAYQVQGASQLVSHFWVHFLPCLASFKKKTSLAHPYSSL